MTEQQRQQRAADIRAMAIEEGERRRFALRQKSPAHLNVPTIERPVLTVVQ